MKKDNLSMKTNLKIMICLLCLIAAPFIHGSSRTFVKLAGDTLIKIWDSEVTRNCYKAFPCVSIPSEARWAYQYAQSEEKPPLTKSGIATTAALTGITAVTATASLAGHYTHPVIFARIFVFTTPLPFIGYGLLASEYRKEFKKKTL